MKLKLFIFLLTLIVCSCKKSINEVDNLSEVIEKTKQGDTNAYKRLKLEHLDYPPGEFLKWAKFYADSLKYKPAYIDVFECYLVKYYLTSEDSTLNVMSVSDKKEALKYFYLGTDKNDSRANTYKKIISNSK